jgi:hypothetical protein
VKNSVLGELFYTAGRVQKLLTDSGMPFCFIGGVAVQRWGRARITKDVDLTLFAGYGDESKALNILRSKFKPRRPDFEEFALNYRIALLEDTNTVGIDVSLGALPYEDEMIKRSSLFEFAPDCLLRTCSAEDLIILKAYANRDQDWFDLRNIIARFATELDRDLIFSILPILTELKSDEQIVNRLRKLIAEYI